MKTVKKSTAHWKSKLPELPFGDDNPRLVTLFELARFESVSVEKLNALIDSPQHRLQDQSHLDRIRIQSLYDMDEARQAADIEEIKKYETLRFPDGFDFGQLSFISNESREKLLTYRPTSIGSAMRIPGIVPSAIFQLFAYFKNKAPQIDMK